MYTPARFVEARPERLQEIIRANSFATIVSAKGGEMVASHLPFMLDASEDGAPGVLIAHMARANPHWRQFDGETEALVIFQGVHGYISPMWYAAGPAVPTWDYEAVHAYGRPAIVSDEARVIAMLHRLVRVYEDGRETPWRSESQGEEYIRGLARGIVAFDIPISRIEGKAKFGQNRPEDQEHVAAAVEDSQPELASIIRAYNARATGG